MERKLRGLNAYIRRDIEESGVNTLYAIFGFLEWYESASSDKGCVSPLLLLQLDIAKKRSRKGYTYQVTATGEEPAINLPLAERLRGDFGIPLPEFAEQDTPEAYMQKVDRLVKQASNLPSKAKWTIRRFITIGRCHFARLVMYHDLGRAYVADNNIVQRLLGGADSEPSGDYAEDYVIDTPEVEKAVPLLVAAADASQHSAVVDAMKDSNLAIKGPPGTGKSQTITNIIANALKTGKSVLFLAEKMAALNVVYKRLSDVNLGPYCLELHSTKAKKTEIINSIAARLALRARQTNDSELQSSLEDFKWYNDRITQYTNVLNEKFGRQDKTIHDYLWGAQRRRDRLGKAVLAIIQQCQIPFSQADLSLSELKRYTDDLKAIASLKKDIHQAATKGKHPGILLVMLI